MPEENITTKFKVDLSELKSGISEANQNIKLANAQFKAASAGMDDWQNSTDGISAKLKQLEAVLEAENTKLKNYQQQLDKVSSAEKENAARADELRAKLEELSSQGLEGTEDFKKYQKALADVTKEQASNASAADKLQITILNQQATVNKTEKEIRNYKSSLDNLENSMQDAESSADELEKGLKDTGDAANNADKEVRNLGDGFTVVKGAIADLIANGIRSFISGVGQMLDETREFRKELALLEQNAATAGFGDNMDELTDKLKEVTAITEDQGAAIEGLSNLLATPFDMTGIDEVTDHLMGAAIKWKDTLKFEGLADGLQETLATGKAVGPFAEMLERAGMSLETFDAGLARATTDAEKQNYVLSELRKLGLADVKTGYEEVNKSAIDMANAQFELTEQMAKISEKVEPTFAAVKQGFADLLGAINLQLDDFNGQALAESISEGFEYFINKILPPVIDGFEFIIKYGNEIITLIGGMASAWATYKAVTAGIWAVDQIKKFVTAMTGAKTIIAGVKAGMAALNITMTLNPFGLIVAAIAAFIAILVIAYNKIEWFRDMVDAAWAWIKETTASFIDAIVKFFTETIPQAIDTTIQWFKNLPTNIANFLNETLATVTEWASNMWNKAIETGQNFVNSIVQFFSELPYKIGHFIGNVLENIVQFGIDLYTFATTEIPKFIQTVVQYFSELPSKIWTWLTTTIRRIIEWGTNLVLAGAEQASKFLQSIINFVKLIPKKVWDWLVKIVQNVIEWGKDLVEKGKDAAQDLFDNIVEIIQGLPEKMLEIGKDIVEGIWNGITGAADWLWDKITGFASGIVDGFKNALDINSPSKKGEWLGKMFDFGIGGGIAKNAKFATDKVKAMADDMMNSAKAKFKNVGTAMVKGIGEGFKSSEASRQLKKINGSILDTFNKSSIAEKVKVATSAVRSGIDTLKVNAANAVGQLSGIPQSKIITINQYNTSPKPLDRLAIYRDTKKLMTQLKGV